MERQRITVEILEYNGFKFEDGYFKWFSADILFVNFNDLDNYENDKI